VLSGHAFRAIIVVGRDCPDEAAYLNSFCWLCFFRGGRCQNFGCTLLENSGTTATGGFYHTIFRESPETLQGNPHQLYLPYKPFLATVIKHAQDAAGTRLAA
jgi:hypothetical protein